MSDKPAEVKVGGVVIGRIVNFRFSNNIPKLAICRCGSRIAAAFCCGTPERQTNGA